MHQYWFPHSKGQKPTKLLTTLVARLSGYNNSYDIMHNEKHTKS